MQRLLIALVACLALALGAFAVGCGDDDDDDTGAATTEETTAAETTGAETTDGGGADGGGEEITVSEVSGNLFEPAEVTAAVGDTVVWTNDDAIAHNAIADNGEFESETMDAGDTFEWKVEGSSGDTVSYVCTFHPGMEGSISIE